jgi:hypothetical protein
LRPVLQVREQQLKVVLLVTVRLTRGVKARLLNNLIV